MNESSQGEHPSNQSNENQNQQENFIALLQDQQKYVQHFQQMYSKSNHLIKQQKFSQASQHLLKCCEMIEIGKNVIKKLNKYWPVCIYINIAYTYQNDWKIQKTNRYLEKAKQLLIDLISSTDKENKEEFLNLTMHLARLKYRQCAVLSQLNQHEKALSVCQSVLPLLKDNIQIILNHAKKQYSLSQREQNQYGVKFGVKVYSFAEEVLTNLLAKMKVSCQALKLSTIKKQTSLEFYYWEKNPERNQMQLRNSFVPPTQKQQTAKRSILGVTKEKTWIDDFNIGDLMKMNPTKLDEWGRNTPLEEYLFKEKIYQYVIYTSVGYFTMATEIRFMDNTKKSNKIQEKIKSKHEQIKKKYGYEQKSQYFALSQSHHLTSISIITENIQTLIPYLSHLIKSFDKHYIFKKKLDEIVAIPQQSVLQGSKISGTKMNSRTVSKASKLGNSSQKDRFDSLEKHKQSDEDYGAPFESNYKLKSKVSSNTSSDDLAIQQNGTAKSQRKTLNNIYQTYAGMDNSLRHKSAAKMRSFQKLSQTLKPKIKRKNLTQQSLNDIKNSLQSIEQKFVKKGQKKTKNTTNTTRREKEKQKQKERISTTKQSHKKTLKNNIKQKLNLVGYEGEGQLHVKHKSCTSFKLVFKKKK